MKIGLSFIFVCSLIFQSVVSGQLLCPDCPPVFTSSPIEVSTQWYNRITYDRNIQVTQERTNEARSYAYRAVRIRNGNSCGTGSLVGRDAQWIYILTNAHVATNRPGHVVQCEALMFDRSRTERFNATVIEGAYSSRDTTDWALLRAPAIKMAGLVPIKMSIRMPNLQVPAYTWGCPRCEVPSGQVVRSVSSNPVWRWQPNAIGGQSGSSVFQRGYAHGLLTWSWGGDGAGQFTSVIYRQSRNQTAESTERPEGLIPLQDGDHADVIEGYHCLTGAKRFADLGQQPKDNELVKVCLPDFGWQICLPIRIVRPTVSTGLSEVSWGQDELTRFNLIEGFVSQSGIGDYPIWGDPDNPDPVDPTDPTDPTDPPSSGLTDEQRAKLIEARRLIDEVLRD